MATTDSTSNPAHQLSFADGFEIPLTRGLVTVVDLCDADLARFLWATKPSGATRIYARRLLWVKGRRINVSLHRIILSRMLGRELKADEYPDHINGDGLDNRRCNLRLANRSENNRNAAKRRDNKSGYKGVSWDKANKAWVAQIRVNKKSIRIGFFDTPELAYEAYCKSAVELHGEFARLK